MKRIFEKIFSPLFIKRINRFTKIKRGYYSFIIILVLYILSFFCEFFINERPLIVRFDNKTYRTIYKRGYFKFKQELYKTAARKRKDYFSYKKLKDSGLKYDIDKLKELNSEFRTYHKIRTAFENSRKLKKVLKELNRGDSAVLSIYPYGPVESLLNELDKEPPTPPSVRHFFGTDDRGRDIFARLVYGFRVSISFALIYTLVSYIIGIMFGAIVGFYGGTVDFFGMRVIEIWSSMPILYMVMILSSILVPSFMLLIFILSLFGWIGMAWYIRAEFLREKNREYVQAAIAIGVNDVVILFKHILPNSLTPLVSFLPFTVIGGISSLVSLDFLGFGLSPPAPSWGELLSQGVKYIQYGYWWLVLAPVGAMFFTLLLISFIGEAIREAFDPKEFSRIR